MVLIARLYVYIFVHYLCLGTIWGRSVGTVVVSWVMNGSAWLAGSWIWGGTPLHPSSLLPGLIFWDSASLQGSDPGQDPARNSAAAASTIIGLNSQLKGKMNTCAGVRVRSWHPSCSHSCHPSPSLRSSGAAHGLFLNLAGLCIAAFLFLNYLSGIGAEWSVLRSPCSLLPTCLS